jgi:hypothetical protein
MLCQDGHGSTTAMLRRTTRTTYFSVQVQSLEDPTQWITLSNHTTAEDAEQAIRGQGVEFTRIARVLMETHETFTAYDARQTANLV